MYICIIKRKPAQIAKYEYFVKYIGGLCNKQKTFFRAIYAYIEKKITSIRIFPQFFSNTFSMNCQTKRKNVDRKWKQN